MHGDNGKRYALCAEEKLRAFVELEFRPRQAKLAMTVIESDPTETAWQVSESPGVQPCS